MHAATLLGAISMSAVEEADPSIQRIFWALIAFYAVLGGGAYFMHRDHGVLLGFYLMLAIRGLNLISMRHGDVDMMRAQVLKNMVMTFAMMLMVAGMVMSDQGGFGESGFGRKAGRSVIFVVGYYLVWALIEWKWPLRIAK
jgi:hypothetical protein